MNNKMVWNSKYFYGKEISDYGLREGYVDYRTLASAFDAVLNNNIINYDIANWEQVSGFVDNTERLNEIEEELDRLYNEPAIADNEEDTPEYELYKNLIEELEEEKEQLEEEEMEGCTDEIYQYYIVSDFGAKLLEEYNFLLFYNEELDIYLWGITHWGTSWDYVLTDIKIELNND